MTEISVTGSFDFGSQEYHDLFRVSNATAFQHPDWLGPFYRILAPAHGVEPLVVVGRAGASGKLALVLPLIRQSDLSASYAFLGVTDYACPVAAPAAIGGEGSLSARLRTALGGCTITIAPVRHDHVAGWQALLGVAPNRLAFSAHAMPLAASAADGPNRRFSRRRRGDLARKSRRLGNGLTLEVLGGERIRPAFLEAREFRRGRFHDDPLQLDCGLEFYVDVATTGDTSGLARTFRLSHEGRTVAVLFGLIDKKTFRYVILACNYADYARCSPGLQIFDRAIAHWAGTGGDVFDFTIGDEPYKRELGCVSTPMFGFEARIGHGR